MHGGGGLGGVALGIIRSFDGGDVQDLKFAVSILLMLSLIGASCIFAQMFYASRVLGGMNKWK